MNRFFIFAILLSGCGGADFTLQQQTDGGAEALSTGATGGDDTGTGGAASSEDAGAGGLVAAVKGSGGAGGSAPSKDAGGDACTLVTHNNGLGQTWQDCTPLGTYNEEEALKACKASVSTSCVSLDWCGPGYTLRGYDARGVFVGEWGVGGTAGGCVAVGNGQGGVYGSACTCSVPGSSPGGSTWE